MLRGFACALILTACVGDFDPDQYAWSCTANRDCGAGYRCQVGTCVAVDATTDTGDAGDTLVDLDTGDTEDTQDTGVPDTAPTPRLNCTAARAATGLEGQAEFSLDLSTARPRLTVRIDALEAAFDFPEDVALVPSETGPLLTCCEQPCCRPE